MYKIISGSERKITAGGADNFECGSSKMIRNFQKSHLFVSHFRKRSACGREDTKRAKKSYNMIV